MRVNWSPQQENVFQWFEKSQAINLVVRARAGTGKTTTIVEGIDRAPESDILLAAFNKKIATELENRIKNPKAEAKTLHSLGFGMLRRYWSNVRVNNDRGRMLAEQVVGNGPDVMVTLVKRLAAVGKNAAPFADILDLMALAEDFDCVPDVEWEKEGWDCERVATLAAEAMNLAATKKDGMCDFDDMVFVPVRNKWMRGQYGLVVIDECQDMNASQIALAVGVCKPGGRIAVVGDDRQAIYGFRGADSNSLDRLKKELNAIEMPLTITRRCPKLIVSEATRLVPDFQAAPEAPQGDIQAISITELPKAVQIGDFVLSRKNAPLVRTCLSILRTGTRSRVEGRDVGKGLIALVEKLAKGKAANSMPVFLEKLTRWQETEVARWRAKNSPAKVAETEDKVETLTALSEGLTGVPELQRRINDLFTDDAMAQGCVVCSSVHKSKGLEADRVFVLRDTLYPGKKAGLAADLEEQNIEYVAITRAKTTLVWVTGL